MTANNFKRKSKFKKCPNAPKRFKSAYIFFSTDMMQSIKAEQKGRHDEKQKITDISKQISVAWKDLIPQEKSKWNIIAKKDKDRYLEEKKNYKGPWQLPVTHNIPGLLKPKKGRMTPRSEYDGEGYTKTINSNVFQHRNSTPLMVIEDKNKVHNVVIQQKLEKVSQDERDAAHNLVQLHLQSTHQSTRSNSISVSSYTRRASHNSQTTLDTSSSSNEFKAIFPQNHEPKHHMPSRYNINNSPVYPHSNYYYQNYPVMYRTSPDRRNFSRLRENQKPPQHFYFAQL